MSQETITKLLSPYSFEEFMREYWDKKILYIPRNDASYFKDVISLDEIDDLLSRKDVNYPTIRLAKESTKIDPATYTKFSAKTDEILVDQKAVNNHFKNGATIALQYMKFVSNSINAYCEALGETFESEVQANIYITPRDAKGFSLHYDAHNLFVSQIHGQKEWILYDALEIRPTRDQLCINRDFSTAVPKHMLTLKPGDLLYIPRGFGHEAKTTNDASIHITTSLFPPTWVDLFKKGFEEFLTTNLAVNTAISPFLSDTEKLAYFEKINQEFMDKLDFNTISQLLKKDLENKKSIFKPLI